MEVGGPYAIIDINGSLGEEWSGEVVDRSGEEEEADNKITTR